MDTKDFILTYGTGGRYSVLEFTTELNALIYEAELAAFDAGKDEMLDILLEGGKI